MARDERDSVNLLEGDFGEMLNRFDEALLASGGVCGCEIVNHFPPGQYVRECRMPAGMAGTSMVHKHEHVFILAEGVITVRDQDGVKHLSAPWVGITKPGTRRALYAHTKVVWITTHPNPDDCRDVPEIVERLTDAPANSRIPPELANHWKLETPVPALKP